MFILDSSRFDEAYKILDNSFPNDELKIYPRLLTDYLFGKMKIYALTDGNKLSAVITIWEFETFVFVENFAVEKSKRNQGLGTKLIESVLSHYADKTVLLEVEVPITELQKRRVNFYVSKGFILSNIVYTQPQLRDTPSDVKLCLMHNKEGISHDALNACKYHIFTRVYGATE